jgi:hypothetical protein
MELLKNSVQATLHHNNKKLGAASYLFTAVYLPLFSQQCYLKLLSPYSPTILTCMSGYLILVGEFQRTLLITFGLGLFLQARRRWRQGQTLIPETDSISIL